MSASPETLAAAALALVGCPFRLHGREPATGLDCVGLVAAALAAIGVRPVAPGGYTLRNLDIAQWLPMAERSGLVPSGGPVITGDVMLIALPPCQHHLAIALGPQSVVHAHAGLRRVVRQPVDPAWQIAARWHLSPLKEG
jgi:hypothetical protein